ncbi:MAG TPA: RNA polymerase sporulation sigma factor SigH [Clostridiales bacterium]|nr:MAG: RNA polymerase factor sigma-70 [Clostridiales bacterium GWD2_32_59]HAN10798.1 RNA polymerase sporulation sigma factor SigH [Clostridiales bacterium]
MEYKEISDEQILEWIYNDEKYAMDALIDRYKEFVKRKARAYFLVGADSDDIIQEGMIGLYKAIRDYKTEKQSSFKTFANMCIDRQMITAVKSATRNKHKFLNNYISLNRLESNEETEDISLIDIMVKDGVDPEKLLLVKENIKHIQQKIQTDLSEFERDTLFLYLKGMKYIEIATEINVSVKSVDNCVQRIKTKLAKALL